MATITCRAQGVTGTPAFASICYDDDTTEIIGCVAWLRLYDWTACRPRLYIRIGGVKGKGVYTMKETINYEQEYQQSVYEALCYMYGDNWCDSDDIDERVVFA